MLLFVSSIGCSIILIVGNWAFSWSENPKITTVLVNCFDTTTILQNLVLKWRRYTPYSKMAAI